MGTNPSVVRVLDDFARTLASKRTLQSQEHAHRLFVDDLSNHDPNMPLDGVAVYFGGIGIKLGVCLAEEEVPARTIALVFRGKFKVRHLLKAVTENEFGYAAFALAVTKLHFFYHVGANLFAHEEPKAEIAEDLTQVGVEVSVLAAADNPGTDLDVRVVFGH